MSTQIYDAIVIGAGSVGLPTALFLAEAGLSTLVIDQFAGPGPGQQQGGHRRHPRHPLHAGEDPAVPRVAADLLHLGGRSTATTSSGRRAATSSSPTASRRSGRSRTCCQVQQQLRAEHPLARPRGDARARAATSTPRGCAAAPTRRRTAPRRRCCRRAPSTGGRCERGVQFRFGERVTGIIRRRGQRGGRAHRQGRLRHRHGRQRRRAPGPGRSPSRPDSTCRSCPTATRRASPSRWRRSSRRCWWTSARPRDRATTTSTSTSRAASSSASRRTRRSSAPTGARPPPTCR